MVFGGEAAKEKFIRELSEEDFVVWIEGFVISKGEGKLLVDDGTASVEVYSNPPQLEGVEEGNYVRIIGRVFPTPSGIEVHADIIKRMELKNPKEYTKARELWLKFNEMLDRMLEKEK